MNAGECIEYLQCNALPPCLNFNIAKSETINYNMIHYNDYAINIVRQKRHKYILGMPGYNKYLEKIIEEANKEKPIRQLEQILEN